MASQARHELVAPQETCASRNVVPQEKVKAPNFFRGFPRVWKSFLRWVSLRNGLADFGAFSSLQKKFFCGRKIWRFLQVAETRIDIGWNGVFVAKNLEK
jgi:hypothetical protein